MSGERRSSFRAGRVVVFRLTEYAERRARYEGAQLFGPSLDEAVGEILTQLGRAPAEVAAKAIGGDSVAVADVRPGQPRVPLALVLEGLTEIEINQTLARLAGPAAARAA